jgi:hypothetical protein
MVVKSRKKKYVRVLMPDHPRNRSRYVFEHILVAEKALGKHLPPGAVVHHVDEDGLNNKPWNLVICQDNAYHRFLHKRLNQQHKGEL